MHYRLLIIKQYSRKVKTFYTSSYIILVNYVRNIIQKIRLKKGKILTFEEKYTVRYETIINERPTEQASHYYLRKPKLY